MSEQLRIVVPCGHPGCRLPVGHLTVEEGVLILSLTTRHHGVLHRTRVALGALTAILLTADGVAATLPVTTRSELSGTGS